jgi:glycerol dehydrogenase
MKIFGAPCRYIQGNGVLDEMGDIVAPLGKRIFVFADEIVLNIVGKKVETLLKNLQNRVIVERFGGECCESEILRLGNKAKKIEAEVLIGLGGGKALDTAKAISARIHLPLVLVPTIAASDAPTSQVAVIYDEKHAKTGAIKMTPTVVIVLVDTGIIGSAPVRFLIAGMGDAISTKFEAEACWAANAVNAFGGMPFNATLYLGNLAYDIIRTHGEAAITSVKKKEISLALENVIEANILLSGLGWESGGVAAAHAIHGGFTVFEEMSRSLHGEKVGYGVLVQLFLERRQKEFILDLVQFYKRIGLPTRIADLAGGDFGPKKIEKACDIICQEGSSIHKMPFPVNRKMVIEAIMNVEQLGDMNKA